MRGAYSTKQREIILSLLRESSTHMTATDIIYLLQQRGIDLSSATVYRTLDRFEKDGIIRKMSTGDSSPSCYQLIDSSACHEHFHLKCIRCGRLIHLDCDFLQDMEKHIWNHHSFKISSGRTVIYGTCEECLEK